MTTIQTTDLLAAVGAHLAAFELPATASVHVRTANVSPQVTVQLAAHQPADIARGLLAWADTLTDVSAQAWRVPRGDSVHLSVTGLLADGTAVLVYSGLPTSQCRLAADLTPNATTTVPLAALRHAATEGKATA